MRKYVDLNDVYPIGSIYMSVVETNPSNLFGGIWEQIEGKFLLGCDSTKAVNTTGGSENHTHDYGLQFGGYFRSVALEQDENAGVLKYDSNGDITLSSHTRLEDSEAPINGSVNANDIEIISMTHYRMIGNTSYTSNLPPYLSVYIWKRIS